MVKGATKTSSSEKVERGLFSLKKGLFLFVAYARYQNFQENKAENMNKNVNLLLLFIFILACSACAQTEQNSHPKVWLDPSLNSNESQTVVVWFDKQFLEAGDSFKEMTKKFEGQGRSVVKKTVISRLQTMSNESHTQIESKLNALIKLGKISNLKRHWIINGFSCTATPEGLKALQKLKGVAKIFRKQPPFLLQGTSKGPTYLEKVPSSRFKFAEIESYPWNIKKIRAPEVWEEFEIIGEGTLNIVHDFGFKLDIPPLAETIYTNKGEIPGNNIDDDDNGYIDDYHGYNFDKNNANLNSPVIRRGSLIHGNACAAMISGTFATDTKQAIGIAPASKWAPVIGAGSIEEAVEWAIEQGADTYSMSFSQPNLGEYRTHWRKVLEQATFCGIVFISGAGNFAAGNAYAPIPVQMRNPEDIPDAVLGVAGVGETGQRPPFSSQGPVAWNTDHYREGEVSKPDFSTLNHRISCVDLEGKLSNVASGNSFAGPHIAGIVSLMLSANPELNPWEVKDILIKTADDIGKPGFDYQSGHGFVNAYDAVREVINRK